MVTWIGKKYLSRNINFICQYYHLLLYYCYHHYNLNNNQMEASFEAILLYSQPSSTQQQHSGNFLIPSSSTQKKIRPLFLDDSRKKSKKKHWKPFENAKYVEFLQQNMNLFGLNRQDKRIVKINKLMSQHVRSKNSTQCRSHHQKMLLHYKSIENIILYLCAEDEQFHNISEKNVDAVPVENLREHELALEQEQGEEASVDKDVFEVLDQNCWGYMDLNIYHQ